MYMYWRNKYKLIAYFRFLLLTTNLYKMPQCEGRVCVFVRKITLKWLILNPSMSGVCLFICLTFTKV